MKRIPSFYKLTYIVGSLVLAGGYSSQAVAQMINYGSLQSIFGEPVTTSATGIPQRASEVPANMTIITADEIRQSGSRSIPQIIGIYVSGTDVLREGVNGYDVGIRGYQQPTNPRLLVLVDGRQVFVDDYSRTIWDNIPVNVDDIRQIEVVKGAASALFGSNAAGGVINIVTYSPLYDKNNVASAGIGTQHERNGDFTVTFNDSWGGTKISGGGLNVNEFNVARPAGDPDPVLTPYHRYIADSSVFQINPKLQLNAEMTYAESTALIGDPTNYYTMGSQVTTTYSFRGGANWQTPYGTISTDNYFNHSFIDLYETSDGGVPYGSTTTLLFNQIQDQFRIGPNNTFRIALEERYKTYRDAGFQSIPINPEFSDTNSAISAMWLWQINDKLSWTNSIRGDHLQEATLGDLIPGATYTQADYSHVNNSWSANSDLVYKATDLDTVKIGYGRGIQQPSFLNSGYAQAYPFAGAPTAAESNPQLKPTVVEDYSVDYDRSLPAITSDVKLSVFYEFNRDIVAPFIPTGGCVFLSGVCYIDVYGQNVGNSQGMGGEIEIKGSRNGFRWDASYSLASLKDSPGVAQWVDYQKSAPEHHFRLNSGYTMGKWEFDVNGQLVSSTDMLRSYDGGVTTSPIPIGGYFNLGGRIGYNITDHFTLALSGNNLSYKTTTESPYPAIERQAFLMLTGRF